VRRRGSWEPFKLQKKRTRVGESSWFRFLFSLARAGEHCKVNRRWEETKVMGGADRGPLRSACPLKPKEGLNGAPGHWRSTSPLKPKEGLNGAPGHWRSTSPLKPTPGLNGPLALSFLLLVRAFLLPTAIQSPRVPGILWRSGESCSTPNPPHARTIRALRDCGGYSGAFV
jgi:hypothetical protein